MADHEQASQQKLEQIESVLEVLTQIEPHSDLVRGEELGSANFGSGIPIFRKTLDLFKELRSSDLSVLPLNILEAIYERANRAKQQFDEIREFSLSGQSEPMTARDKIIESFHAEYQTHFQSLEPHINYLLIKQTDFAALEQRAREAMTRLDEFTIEKQAEQEAIRSQMESALQSVRDAAAKAGVGQESMVFATESEAHNEHATLWLRAAAASGVLALAYAVYGFVLSDVPSEPTGELIRTLIGRTVILSIVLFATAFSIRQYAAARHNETVNRHRQNALRTFETFVNATDDVAIKDAVLLEATRSIFAGQPSGFLKHEVQGDSPNMVFEIVRRLGQPSE